MDGSPKPLCDDGARRAALADHHWTLLVEAGAGSGKTAVLAGRIALMLAEGVDPKSIAAVTFTEPAASELLHRVRKFVTELNSGKIPADVRVALPNGVSDLQRANLARASHHLDDVACTTIHGFCQRLITPYPVEANIDPGASIMDRSEADLTFEEIVDHWLREQLNGTEEGLLAALVIADRLKAVELVQTIAASLRKRTDLKTAEPPEITVAIKTFKAAATGFSGFLNRTAVKEDETGACAESFAVMADALGFDAGTPTASDLATMLTFEVGEDLHTTARTFRKLQKKGKWEAAAKSNGFSKADGEQMFEAAKAHYDACGEAWDVLQQVVASRILAQLVEIVRPVGEAYRTYKRSAALLDFDDLIRSARDLLRDHESVRQALSLRYQHILVDEFQDTDPLQAEIFWRLCGEAQPEKPAAAWTELHIRPGALFLVGDPKQAIYRFRGADVQAYLDARDRLLRQDDQCLLSIVTNFRSCAPILNHVNECFESPLSAEKQPGFSPLDAFRPARSKGVCVAALDVQVAGENGKPNAEQQRDGEADAVAELCLHLIEDEQVLDAEGTRRACRPGDIALLAPAGTELWRYEAALEKRGIPVATQAGKGFFQRQEVQDLIAITRVLADARDSLALGALLRGPLVGLGEEELLDIIAALPRDFEKPDDLPRLDIRVEPASITHAHASDIVEKLQLLRRGALGTTPYDLLSRSVDVLRVRLVLLQRHGWQAERALANVDLYLSLSRAYAVRGLRAFAEAMTGAWTDKERAMEGRPDAQDEAVTLYTMHSAKGLEWPIVIPINAMTTIKGHQGPIIQRDTDLFYCPVFGMAPDGYEAAVEAEEEELDRERVRLWYVAATRARELLILPRFDVTPSSSAWISIVDLSLQQLPAIDLSGLSRRMAVARAANRNEQTREVFSREAELIAAQHHSMRWLAPSRDEGASGPVLHAEDRHIGIDIGNGFMARAPVEITVQGSRERGLIVHKLMEEVLTGETLEEPAALVARAAVLIDQLGHKVAKNPCSGLFPAELASCINRALNIPEIQALRPTLKPEFPVYASSQTSDAEEIVFGIADAISYSANDCPEVVVDWKSDVSPSAEMTDQYRGQVSAYLKVVGADVGLIVFVTSGTLVCVRREMGSLHGKLVTSSIA